MLLLPGGRQLEHWPVAAVAITALLPSDSPRTGGENEEHVRTLADVHADTPPIVVHRQTMRVIDGMHRLRAAMLRGQHTIDVRFFDGTEQDAFVLAVELNSAHGLPLSQTDRNAAAARIVESHPHWSDRVIASLTGLSAKTVAAVRTRASVEIPQSHGRIGKDGRVRPTSTALGRQQASKLMSEQPALSLRDIARETGVSVGTVRDVRRRLSMGLDPVPAKQRPGPQDQETPRPLPAIPPALLRQLKQDPSLRLSEAGRILLRLLDAHSIPTATWTRLAGGVPSHCAEAVANLALSCADSWRQFAEHINQRDAT